MKFKYAYPTLIAASAFAFTSCDNKKTASPEETTPEESVSLIESAQESSTSVIENVKETIQEVVTPAASAEERVAKLGFVKFLSEDTEGVFSFYDGKGLVNAMRGSAIGTLLEKNLAEQGINLDEVVQNQPQAAILLSALSEEFFVALGNNAGQQGEHALKLSNAISYGQMKMTVKAMAAKLQGEEPDIAMMQSEVDNMIMGILSDPNAGLEVIEKLDTPLITIGMKISDVDQRDQLAGMFASFQQMFTNEEDSPVEAFELEKDGFQFTGVKIVGKKLADSIEPEDRIEMAQSVGGEANLDRLITALEKKNLIISSVVKDDYFVISLAGSEDDIKFATSADKSVASNKEFKFIDNHLDKKINLLAFSNKEALTHLLNQNQGSIYAYIGGIEAGLKETEAFGDTTDIETLLTHVQKLGKEYDSLYKPQTFGSVGFLENGFKIESHGGSNQPTIDSNKVHQLAPLGAKDDVFFYANWTNDEKAMDLALDFLDSLGETAYTMSKQAAGLEVPDSGLEEFSQTFGLFDEKFSQDLKELWIALRGDFAAGVGSENALVIDLNGGLPKVPGVPAPFLENGKMPRVTFAAPVENRDKLGQSWTRLNGVLTNVLKNASEMTGMEIPMQEAISSTNDGQTSWFFTTIPFTTNDFMPNVTVSDEFFFASTSKALAGELEAAVKAGGGVERKGAYAEVNFQALHKYLKDWLELVKANQDALFQNNPSGLADFQENLPMIEDALRAFGSLDRWSLHTREEGGETRSSIHFKTK